MEELGLQGGDSDVQPNSRTYCTVLDTLARSKSYKACKMSLEILQRMHGKIDVLAHTKNVAHTFCIADSHYHDRLSC